MQIRLTYLLFAGILLTFLGCKEPEDPPTANLDLTTGTWILNEGTFRVGNASLTFLSPEGDLSQNVFSDVNGIPLGDVAQSLIVVGDAVYIIVNNSGTIYKVDRVTGAIEGTIDGLTSPRYLLPYSSSKGYVSDLYSGTLHVIDLTQFEKTGEIQMGADWTEQMLMVNGDPWVTVRGSNQVAILDPLNDAIAETIEVAFAPHSMVQDSEGKVWVLCSDEVEPVDPELVRINPFTRTVEKRFVFPDRSKIPQRLRIDEAGENIYYLNGDLYQLGIRDTNLSTVPVVNADGRNFYNYKLQGTTVWMTDAKDYQATGEVIRFDLASGSELARYSTGTTPSEILFLD